MTQNSNEKTIRQHALSGMIWGTFGQFGNQIFNFILSVILARLLMPEEFGLLALITFFISISDVFINSGLGTALIKTKNLRPIDFSTVFYYNITLSCVFYILVIIAAPYIAAFYNNVALINIIYWSALTLIINSFTLVQSSIAAKELNFKKIKLIELAGLGISIPISIAFAYNNYGIYSLVALNISQSFSKSVLYWISSKWRPIFGFSRSSFKKLFGFGSKILMTNIFSTFINNIESVLIGKMFSAAALGYYFRAFSTKDLPLKTFSTAIALPIYALLAKYNDNMVEFKKIHLKFYKLIAFLFFPLAAGMVALAKPLVIVLYTDKWLPSVPMIQIMSISIVTFLLGYLQDQTIIAIGGSSKYFKLTIINRILKISTIPIGILFGLIPFVVSLTFVSILNLLYSNYIGGKYLNMNNIKYVLLIKPFIIASIFMGNIIYILNLMFFENQIIKLTVLSFLGIIIYISIAYAFKFHELQYIFDIIRPYYDKIRIIKRSNYSN